MKKLIYDIEIVNAIPPRDFQDRLPNLRYCAGWGDFANMGIAVICTYDYVTDSYGVFMQDNLNDFAELVQERDCIIGYNSFAFDDKLCEANGIEIETTYDLLREIRASAKQPRDFVRGKTKAGYRLGQVAEFNLGQQKSMDGEKAPMYWQKGLYGAVIHYCLQDIALTKKLFELAEEDKLKDPNTGQLLRLNRCSAVFTAQSAVLHMGATDINGNRPLF